MHTPYEERLGHPADFKVRYRFYSKEEGGRRTIIPYQGYRSDFQYFNSAHKPGEIFMIWPEFEDGNGNVIREDDRSVLPIGTARMWVIVPERRPYHYDKIQIGMIGYFVEGNTRVADCEVIEILGLKSNPVSRQLNAGDNG
jgi:hypothetical protein